MNLSSYDKTLSALLNHLPQRSREVLVRRYGLFGAKPETLEEIGGQYKVTRERVRQIEANAFSQLRNEYQHHIAPLLRTLERHLQDHGAVRAEQHLFEDFAPRVSSATLQALLDLGEPFSRHRETDDRHAVWTTDAKRMSEAEVFEKALVAELRRLKQEFSDASFWEFAEREARHRKLSLAGRALQSWVGISRNILQGPRGTWGLASWSEIMPHNVGDWAFIVMRDKRKPMHFSDIVRSMNALDAREDRKAHLQTVHNELIKDPRFVLVGRGLYALREWGYEPGTVRDVIEKVLKDAKAPLRRDELVAKVASMRHVQKNTIILNLQNKAAFARTSDGRYTLKRA